MPSLFDSLSRPYDDDKIIDSVRKNIVSILSTRVVRDGMITNNGAPCYYYYGYGLDSNIWDKPVDKIKLYILSVLSKFEKRVNNLNVHVNRSGYSISLEIDYGIAYIDYYITRLSYEHKISSCQPILLSAS